MRPLKQDKNPYIKENQEYYNKRREKLIEAKLRNTLYKLYKQKCPICEQSLHNDEPVELHHIEPRKTGGKYSLKNILPLHRICHQQVSHKTKDLKRFLIATPKKIKKENKTKDKEQLARHLISLNKWLKGKKRFSETRDRIFLKNDCTSRVR